MRVRSQQPIRAVLFDKDGTLLDYQRTWTPINREVALLAAGGDAALAETLLAIGGQDPRTGHVEPGSALAAGTHEEIAAAFAAHLGAATPPGLADSIASIFATSGARHAVLVADAVSTLERLARDGFVMGVASNDTWAGIRTSLGRHRGVLEHFVFLAGCDSGFGAKPEPGMVHAFAAATSIPAGAIAVIGDSQHDLEMARRAGAGLKIGVCGGTTPYQGLAGQADTVLDVLSELPALLSLSLRSQG